MAATQPINRSRRILSGRGEDESISQARAVMTSFERVWTLTRHTDVHHPRCRQVLRLFFEHLRAYTDAFGELSMDVSPYVLSIDGQPILKVERKRENYINRLFLDDIRQLVLHPELSEDELLRFMDVLRTDFTDPRFLEDDIVTLLWHEGLSGISYSVYDTIEDHPAEGRDGVDQPDTSHGVGFPQAKNAGEAMGTSTGGLLVEADAVMAQAMSEQPTASTSTDKPEGDDLPVVVSAGDRLLRDLAPTFPASESEETDSAFFGFTPQQTKALRDKLRACEAMVPRKFGEILLQSLQALPAAAGDQIVAGFGSFVLSSLALESEAALVQTLGAMASLGRTPEGKLPYARLLSKMQDAEVSDALGKRLDASQLPGDLLNLVNVMGDDNFPLLWERMRVLTNPNARHHLLGLLTPFANNHLSFLIEQVARGHEDAALQALSLLKQVPISLIARDLLSGLRHTSPTVRLAVANMVQQEEDSTVQQTLLNMVNDAEEQVRLAVIQILTDNTASAGIEPVLLAAIRKPGFSRRNPEEKRRTISGLGRVAGSEGLEVLRSLALGLPSSPVKGDPETQIAAIRALAGRSDRDAVAGLKKLAGGWFGNKEIKRAARFAISVINRQREK